MVTESEFPKAANKVAAVFQQLSVLYVMFILISFRALTLRSDSHETHEFGVNCVRGRRSRRFFLNISI
jgi:hypothetical protein